MIFLLAGQWITFASHASDGPSAAAAAIDEPSDSDNNGMRGNQCGHGCHSHSHFVGQISRVSELPAVYSNPTPFRFLAVEGSGPFLDRPYRPPRTAA